MTRKARNVVQDVSVFMEDVLLMPDEHRAVRAAHGGRSGPAGRARAVADYVAGMTDRYAIASTTGCSCPRRGVEPCDFEKPPAPS